MKRTCFYFLSNVKMEENHKEVPYQHIIKHEEEEFFQKEVNSQKAYNELLDIPDAPIYVNMTIEKYFRLFKWKYKRDNSLYQLSVKATQ